MIRCGRADFRPRLLNRRMEIISQEMGVAQRHGDAAMAKDHLKDGKVTGCLEKHGGETVPEIVAAKVYLGPRRDGAKSF